MKTLVTFGAAIILSSLIATPNANCILRVRNALSSSTMVFAGWVGATFQDGVSAGAISSRSL